MATYRLALANRSTSGLGSEIISDILDTTGIPQGDAGIRWTKILNAPGAIEFTLPLDHASVTATNFAVGNREIHLYRDSTLVAAGNLTGADVSGWAVRFTAQGFYGRLRRRVVVDDLLYDGVDQLDIAWNLINHTQTQTNGNLGITRYSATSSGVARTTVYCIENAVVIADAIEELAAAADGFDFEVTPNKVWRTWYPRRAYASGITLTDADFTDLTYSLDAEDLVTEARGIVPADSDCNLPTVLTASGGGSTYGLLQTTVDAEDNDTQSFLQSKVDEEYRINGSPRFKAQVILDSAISPYGADDFDIGHTLTLQADRGSFVDLNRSCRVAEFTVAVPTSDREIITLGLDGVA